MCNRTQRVSLFLKVLPTHSSFSIQSESIRACKSCPYYRQLLDDRQKELDRCQSELESVQSEMKELMSKSYIPSIGSASDSLVQTVAQLQQQVDDIELESRLSTERWKKTISKLEDENRMLKQREAELLALAETRNRAPDVDLECVEARAQQIAEIEIEKQRQSFDEIWSQHELSWQAKLAETDVKYSELARRFEVCLALLGEKTEILNQLQIQQSQDTRRE